MIPQRFQKGDRVRFIGHPDHADPPILAGVHLAAATGMIEDGGYGDLYRLKLDGAFGGADAGCVVQIHAMQVERADDPLSDTSAALHVEDSSGWTPDDPLASSTFAQAAEHGFRLLEWLKGER